MKLTTSGKLQIILGPMFSGKTSELIRRLVRYRFAGYRVALILNDRQPHQHTELSYPPLKNISVLCATSLQPLLHYALSSDYDVIGIDEGHAFEDLVEFAGGASEAGKKVVVAALDGDSERKGFTEVLRLIPLAESVVKLSAVCMSCANEAPYTKLLPPECVQGDSVRDRYMAVCQACYDEPASVKRSPFKTHFKMSHYLSAQPRTNPSDLRSVARVLMETS